VTVYLDHAATTPMHPQAVEAMLPFLFHRFGNPSGSHAVAREANKALEEARDVVAACLGALPGEVVFTAGGTEADNLAITGRHIVAPGVVVSSAVEHHAVLHTCAALGGRVAPVTATGAVDLDRLAALLDPGVSVVSVMLVNNEVGTIQPLADVAELVRERAPDAVVHTDAVQAFSWLDVAVLGAPADLVAVSAHKFGGPKGVGALVVRDGVKVAPILHGGGQERDRRSGTHNVAGIVGMAAAMQATGAERDATVLRVGALRDRLVDGLLAAVPDSAETGIAPSSGPAGIAPSSGPAGIAPSSGPAGSRSAKVAGNAHLSFVGIESESLLVLLDGDGVCASAGSACTSGAMEASHVLMAMGIDRDRALGSLRLSLGATTTEADVDQALAAVPAAVARLRGTA